MMTTRTDEESRRSQPPPVVVPTADQEVGAEQVPSSTHEIERLDAPRIALVGIGVILGWSRVWRLDCGPRPPHV